MTELPDAPMPQAEPQAGLEAADTKPIADPASAASAASPAASAPAACSGPLATTRPPGGAKAAA
eukprot:8444798-Lingulodinium_polyedra.AAC.1